MMLGAEILEPRRRRFGRWTAATALVVSLHVGAVAMALHSWPREIDDEPSGAIAIELAPLTATTDSATDDAALAPDAEAATPAESASPPEKTVEHQDETPLVDPSPAREAEAVVPIAKPEEKKQEETRKQDIHNAEAKTSPQPVEQPPVQASMPTTAVAPPKADAAHARTPTAARQGRGAKSTKAQLIWQKALLLQLDRYKRYPSDARRKRIEGIATVAFTIDRKGRLMMSRISATSGSTLLDEEALNVLSRASPLPPPPNDIGGATVELALPIAFQIRH